MSSGPDGLCQISQAVAGGWDWKEARVEAGGSVGRLLQQFREEIMVTSSWTVERRWREVDTGGRKLGRGHCSMGKIWFPTGGGG